MDTSPPTPAAIERAIGSYLRTNPNAVDTERGIREWWLAGIGSCRLADVHVAIERLVASGAMVERMLPDGQRAYARSSATNPRP